MPSILKEEQTFVKNAYTPVFVMYMLHALNKIEMHEIMTVFSAGCLPTSK